MFRSNKMKQEHSKTFLSFLRRKKTSTREETKPHKKEGKAKKSSTRNNVNGKLTSTTTTKDRSCRATSSSTHDEADTFSVYSTDSAARETIWIPTLESTEMTPQRHLDALLLERGYEKVQYDCLSTAYSNAPTQLQMASYHVHLVNLVQKRKKNQVQEVDAMLAAGLSPNPCNEFGSSLLQAVCRQGNVELLDVMLRHGCSLQVADEFGRTPLHDALNAKPPAFEVVKRILQVDAHLIHLADSRGHVPFDYVRKEHCEDWIDFLNADVDLIWPSRVESPSPHPLTLRQANTLPLADPVNALSLELAEAVASGMLRPHEAVMLQNDDCSEVDGDSSSSDYSDSSSYDSLLSISEGTEESLDEEDAALVRELALLREHRPQCCAVAQSI